MGDDHPDATIQAIAHRHRRRLIQRLRHEASGQVTVDDLVEHLYRADADPTNGGRPDRDLLHAQLVHSHLPMLANYDIVEFDPAAGTVRYETHEQVEAVLDSLPGELAPAPP